MNQLVALAVVSALGTTSGAALARTHGDTARVLESRPIYEAVSVPAQQCWTQPVTTYETRRVATRDTRPVYVSEGPTGAGAVMGALIGGVVGHQFGNSHRGTNQATAAGAILGGLLGNHIESQSARGYYTQAPAVHVERFPVTQQVQRCRTVQNVEQRIVGYDVRYAYQGREYHTRMEHAPGRTIAVDVATHVRPSEGRYINAYRPGPVAPVYVRGF